jgi:hypothetical protein
MVGKSENEMIYEGYVGRAGMAMDQQRDNKNLKFTPRYDANNSNLRQFSGLTGNGRANAAGMMSSTDLSSQPSDEETRTVEIKGYGVMRLSQLSDLIKRLSSEISDLVDRGIYNVGDKADLLKLFADTYKDNISS